MITLEGTTLSEKRYGALHSRVCLNICVNRGICQESGRKEKAIILFNGDYVWRKEEVACVSVGHEWGAAEVLLVGYTSSYWVFRTFSPFRTHLVL